ncbi:MAG: hypothetical protein JXB26_04090 [Candidatus Aminicenantes bacterium]|nr:hypothetical protein [Candidatus Aminicenantes bacterium]
MNKKKSKNYFYKIYNLKIKSSIRCDELLPSDDHQYDVHIRFGPVPDFLNNALAKSESYQVAEEQVLLKIENTAKYLIKNGNEIVIEKKKDVPDNEINIFLLGSAMGALIHQREMLPLHGCSVEIQNKGFVFLGKAGIGKSTLAASFYQNGDRVLTDDVTVIAFNSDHHPIILPGYPRIKLWDDSMGMIDKGTNNIIFSKNSFYKHQLSIKDCFLESPVPLGGLYLLTSSAKKNIVIKQLSGYEQMIELSKNTYRGIFLKKQNDLRYHFNQCSTILNNVPLKKVIRPVDNFSVDYLRDNLKNDIINPIK